MLQVINLQVIWTLLLLGSCIATISPPDKKPGQKEIKLQEGPRKKSVFDRNLVSEKVSPQDIIKFHRTYFEKTGIRNFNGTVLGYVTPWNPSGYDVAKRWAPKFNYIAPVWLQITRSGVNSYVIAGLHDVDNAWMTTVRQKGKANNVKIVPRLITEGWQTSDKKIFFKDHNEQDAFIAEVQRICKQHKFDGVTLEMSSIMGMAAQDILDFWERMGSVFTKNDLSLIIVYSPFRGYESQLAFMKGFEQIYKSITGISLMTYDFSDASKPGPNAPLPWISLNIEKLLENGDTEEKRNKIFVGLNFYGYTFTSGSSKPIVGREYIEMLQSAKSSQNLIYNNNTAEHYIEVKTAKGSQKIFFPTLFSIQERLEFAKTHGLGISIWELGQGLDYFYDLL